MQPLSAVVTDVLGQLKLEGVRPEDCRLTLASWEQGDGSCCPRHKPCPSALWRALLPLLPHAAAFCHPMPACLPARAVAPHRLPRPSARGGSGWNPLPSPISQPQKGKPLDLGLPLRFANIGRNDKLELTTGEGSLVGGSKGSARPAPGAAAGWCGMA